MQRVSQIALKVLEKHNENLICFYSAGITDDIFAEAWPGRKAHPLDKAQKVLDALDRESERMDALFTKEIVVIWNRRIRAFTIKRLDNKKLALWRPRK